jgi:hypothetical protein
MQSKCMDKPVAGDKGNKLNWVSLNWVRLPTLVHLLVFVLMKMMALALRYYRAPTCAWLSSDRLISKEQIALKVDLTCMHLTS